MNIKNKKKIMNVSLILIIIVATLAVAGFFIYKLVNNNKPKIEENVIQEEQDNTPENPIDKPTGFDKENLNIKFDIFEKMYILKEVKNKFVFDIKYLKFHFLKKFYSLLPLAEEQSIEVRTNDIKEPLEAQIKYFEYSVFKYTWVYKIINNSI